MSKRLTKTIWYGSDVDSNGNPILPSTHGGLDGLNYGELFLHLSNGKATLWTLSSDGKIVEITGGGSEVDMSSYLLKSIWDKVFEIRTDSQGIEYIFGKLPMVTQYGITIYSGDGVNVPSLASGLPFDGRTIWYNPDTNQIEVIGGTGGGSGEGVSNFWDLNGIPSWITITKPKYTYSEIEGTPDLTKYALVSQIPSLSGYATESWVAKQNYATKATTLSGYGITDAYTKTNVDDLLKAYVTLGGTQTITGEKNFTGGLKVNGSPIYYDTDKKYWKLEGDLLVTGGVTMYGNDSSFTPSTIMDAIAVDGTTISKSGGVLKVVGGTGGGVADSVAWANITGKPTWIGSSKPSYSYSEITGAISTTELQNYLTQNSYLNVTSGDNRYLKLSGGTLTNTLTIDNSTVGLILHRSGQATPYIRFGQDANNEWGELGVYNDGRLVFWPLVSSQGGYNQWNTVWHSGNDGSGSELDADMLDGYHASYASSKPFGTIPIIHAVSGYMDIGKHLEFHYDNTTGNDYSTVLGCTGNHSNIVNLPSKSGTLALVTDNVASATKLQTARTIWGQSFDGTGNITGQLNITTGTNVTLTYGTGLLILGTMASAHIAIDTNDIQAKADGTTASTLYLNDYGGNVSMCGNDGNVGIGTTNPTTKFDINGKSMEIGTSIYGSGGVGSEIYMSTHREGSTLCARGMRMYVSGSATGIFQSFSIDAKNYDTLSNIMSINSSGNLLVTGGVTMYSDQRKKTILNHVELSLKQIAEAPLIEHYYNSDDKKTTHVGSIAQYWASMNDWFCKLDSEGYYTMEIQNCALASAISIARELDRYETKTDKAIKKLKKRICELEEEVERLKSA